MQHNLLICTGKLDKEYRGPGTWSYLVTSVRNLSSKIVCLWLQIFHLSEPRLISLIYYIWSFKSISVPSHHRFRKVVDTSCKVTIICGASRHSDSISCRRNGWNFLVHSSRSLMGSRRVHAGYGHPVHATSLMDSPKIRIRLAFIQPSTVLYRPIVSLGRSCCLLRIVYSTRSDRNTNLNRDRTWFPCNLFGNSHDGSNLGFFDTLACSCRLCASKIPASP